MSIFAQNKIQIKQIESSDQVVLRYDTANNYVWGISIPVECEVVFKDKQSKQMWIVDGRHYVPKEFDKLRDYGSQGGWQSAQIKLKVNGEYTSPYILEDQRKQDTCYYWLGTVRDIKSHKEIQDSLSAYIPLIRKLNTKSLPIGTIREFKLHHPNLIQRLLSNDSIEFHIYEKPYKYIESISMPVKYEYESKKQ